MQSQAYLKIENPGVAVKEAFTLLGATTSSDRQDTRTIGKFGSGSKHGVSVCLRNNLSPVIFAGSLRMTFDTRPQAMEDTMLKRVVVKYSGKEGEVSRTSTEDLGYVLNYGASDWDHIDLALREFVSNAIDRAIKEGETAFNFKWQAENGVTPENRSSDEIIQKFTDALIEYRKTARDYQNVTVEIVNENQVRAKSGTTRVFVPLNNDVLNFYQNLGKWFLHFSEPESLDKTILPKANRNIGDRKAAVIYRKGVRVREFEASDVASLFDYNLDNLKMDEARKVDDYVVRAAAAFAIRDASPEQLATLLGSFRSVNKFWEHEFDSYGLDNHWRDSAETLAARKTKWMNAFKAIGGENAVIAHGNTGDIAARKGYTVVTAPENYVKFAEKQGIRVPTQVLTQDDRDGREIVDATPDALAAVDFIWDVIEKNNMTNGKERPKIKCFRQVMENGGQTLGFYRDGTVFFNTDIAGTASSQMGYEALTQQLLATAMEECTHYCTGAIDFVRDFQDYLVNLAVKLAKQQAGLK